MNESPTILKLFAIWNDFWSDLFVKCDLYQICDAEDWLLLIWDAVSVKKIINTPNAVSGPYSDHDLCLNNNNNSFGSSMKQSHLSVWEMLPFRTKQFPLLMWAAVPADFFNSLLGMWQADST